MTERIKVCGVNDATFAMRAEELGANYLGLIFAAGSPRQVSVPLAKSIAATVKGAARLVGVFTTSTVEEIQTVAREVGFQIVQLHRRATAEEVAALKSEEPGWDVIGLAPDLTDFASVQAAVEAVRALARETA